MERLKQIVARTTAQLADWPVFVQGTAFLITRTHALTCVHCLRWNGNQTWAPRITLHFSYWGATGESSDAEVVGEPDWKQDVAILKLIHPVSDDIELLPLAANGTLGFPWTTFAYPMPSRNAGITLDGTIKDPAAQLPYGEFPHRVLQLSCDQGQDSLKGISGGPVLVNETIIGMLNNQLIEEKVLAGYSLQPAEHYKPVYNIVYALPCEAIRGLLQAVCSMELHGVHIYDLAESGKLRDFLSGNGNPENNKELEKAKTLLVEAEQLRISDNNRGARLAYEQAYALYEQEKDSRGQADVLRGLGDLEWKVDNNREARLAYEQAYALYKEEKDSWGQADVLRGLGDLEWKQDNTHEAQTAYDQAYVFYGQEKDSRGQADVLRGLGDLEWKRNDHERARRYYEQALPLYKQVGSLFGQAYVFWGLGNVEVCLNHEDEAHTYFTQAFFLFKKAESRVGQADSLRCLGDLKVDKYNTRTGKDYVRALHLYEQVGSRLGQADTFDRLGEIEETSDHYQEARSAYRCALSLYKQIEDRRGQADVLCNLGDLEYGREYDDKVHSAYSRSLSLYEQIADLYGQAMVLRELGELDAKLDRNNEARNAYFTSQYLYKKINNDGCCINLVDHLPYTTRLGGFHAKPLHTGSESSWHQRLRDLCTRLPARKEALSKGKEGKEHFPCDRPAALPQGPLPLSKRALFRFRHNRRRALENRLREAT